MKQSQTDDLLEKESLGRLMRKYAVPCVISLLVAALYNIVDQIFIANADYLRNTFSGLPWVFRFICSGRQ